MLRIALIGCGKIADQHIDAIARIPDSSVVAVCDRELLMARQLAERYKIEGCFADAGEMLRTAKPDAVHITTPPQGHFALATQCLEAGCHVYLEKPFTVTASEARSLIQTAERQGRRIVAGHNYQFTPETMQMRELVKGGFLGGRATHLDCHFSYDLGDATYVGPLLASKRHWVRQLPGQLLHNILSHPVAKLAEFLDDDLVEVIARADQSPALRKMGGSDVFDELRVMIKDSQGTTAFLCFTTQAKPSLNQLRICGPKNSLFVDQTSCNLIRHETKSFKSYLIFFGPPWQMARQYFRNTRRNIFQFIGRKLFLDFGMKELIQRFYDSIRDPNLPPPIPYREILLTAEIMDQTFAQIYPKNQPASSTPTESPRP